MIVSTIAKFSADASRGQRANTIAGGRANRASIAREHGASKA